MMELISDKGVGDIEYKLPSLLQTVDSSLFEGTHVKNTTLCCFITLNLKSGKLVLIVFERVTCLPISFAFL